MIRVALRWLASLPLYLAVILLRYPLAPLAVALFSRSDRRRLQSWLWWLETIDNDLAGDSGWREQHLVGADPLSWLNRTRWLWRNGGNALNYTTLGVPELPPLSGFYEQRGALHWRYNTLARGYDACMLRKFVWLPIGRRCVELWAGWAIYGPQCGRCKFVLTARLRTTTT